jgi:hypothetical protein
MNEIMQLDHNNNIIYTYENSEDSLNKWIDEESNKQDDYELE